MKPRTKEEAIEMLRQVTDYIDNTVEQGGDVSEVINYLRDLLNDNWMY